MRVGRYTLEGHSLGGVETALTLPELRIAFDVGHTRRELVRCEILALTHTHMDHIGALPWLLALRQLFRMKPPTVLVPAQVADAVQAMLDAWQPVQRYALACDIVAVEPGQRYPVGRNLFLEPFRTYHPVPSNGYTLIETVDKLKPELIGTPGPELAARRKAGEVLTNTQQRQLLSVTGDTLVEVLDKQPQILASDVLVCECTFLDARKPLRDARQGGHISLSELLERASCFGEQTLVLSHFSQIYKPSEVAPLLAPLAAAIRGPLYTFPMTPGQTAERVPPEPVNG